MVDRIKTADLARGRWQKVLVVLGVPYKALSGNNGPCVFCGGKDRARFTDWNDRGWYFCNQCGKYDGFKFLMKFHGWSFAKTAGEIDRVLSTNAIVSLSKENYKSVLVAEKCDVPRSTRDCALWLRKFRPEKLESWLESKAPEVRWWLESRAV